VPSNLCIVDYSHGFTGSAHDSAAFEHTAAAKHGDWFFEGKEFAWGDSAYTVNKWTIPVHKRPASLQPENAIFDHVVAHLRVRSEHCMGALKGCFQCLRGLRVNINLKQDHIEACRWITVAIILHNLILDVEGQSTQFVDIHMPMDEQEDCGQPEQLYNDDDNDENDADGLKRCQLVAELLVFKAL
jgi:hypothetical protein